MNDPENSEALELVDRLLSKVRRLRKELSEDKRLDGQKDERHVAGRRIRDDPSEYERDDPF